MEEKPALLNANQVAERLDARDHRIPHRTSDEGCRRRLAEVHHVEAGG